MASSNSDTNQTARRVCILQELGQRSDWTRLALEQYEPNPRTRACQLTGHTGLIATNAMQDDATRLRQELVRLAGDALEWIEDLDRQAAW